MNYVGKYRGVVTDVSDPMLLGRIKAKVPDVLGTQESGWALPCLPFAGQGMGFFALPKVSANVWIEFEHGDPEYPIWSGCFYSTTTEVPATAVVPPGTRVLLRTTAGHSILLDDTAATSGIQIKTATGETLKLSTKGLQFTDSVGTSFVIGPDGLAFTGVGKQAVTAKAQELSLALASGQKVTLAAAGVTLVSGSVMPAGKIELQGPKVAINGPALEVT